MKLLLGNKLKRRETARSSGNAANAGEGAASVGEEGGPRALWLLILRMRRTLPPRHQAW